MFKAHSVQIEAGNPEAAELTLDLMRVSEDLHVLNVLATKILYSGLVYLLTVTLSLQSWSYMPQKGTYRKQNISWPNS